MLPIEDSIVLNNGIMSNLYQKNNYVNTMVLLNYMPNGWPVSSQKEFGIVVNESTLNKLSTEDGILNNGELITKKKPSTMLRLTGYENSINTAKPRQ